MGTIKSAVERGDEYEGNRRMGAGTKEERGVCASNSRSNCPKEQVAVKR